MQFSSVVGQQFVKERLIRSVTQGRVSHAQLYLGPEGSGTLPLALAFAQFINCENRQETDSCGTCPSCIKSQKLIHPDIHFSYPAFKLKSGSENPALSVDFIKPWREFLLTDPYQNLNEWLDFIEAENKQGNISADECRSMIHQLNLKTFESSYKVMIIWMAEMLGKEGNILLKLLEEPPPNSVLLLIAENRDQLLSTILSRCQVVLIPRVSDDEMMEALMNRHSLSLEDAMKVTRQAEGSYREAERVLARTEEDESQLFKQWMRLLIERNQEELVKWIDGVARIGREKQKSLFRYALEFVRACLALQHAGNQQASLQDDERKMGEWFVARLDLTEWEEWRNRFESAHYHIERNAHPKILFMNLSQYLSNRIAVKKLSLTGMR